MYPKLKSLVEHFYSLCDSCDSSPVNPANLRLNKATREVFRLDLMAFVMYLSASDGRINHSEAIYISDLLGCDASPEQITELIKNANIYSTKFEQSPPLSLHIMVREDKRLIKLGATDVGKHSEILIDIFELVGKDIMVADHDIADNERTDFNIYINMLKRYVQSELNSTSKNNTGTPAKNTLKSQYEILKKN